MTSCQVADPAGRTNTSQNVGLADIGTIAQLSLAVLERGGQRGARPGAGAPAAAAAPRRAAESDGADEAELHAASAALDAIAATAAASAPPRTRAPRREPRRRGACRRHWLCPIDWSTESASIDENEDWVAPVPGPGSSLISC